MTSNRRASDRVIRRVPVRFWRVGQERTTTGYTTNISGTGMYVVTHQPAPRGARIRVEVLDPRCGFIVEAEVAHAHRVSTEMSALGLSGMGVRFLPVADLVRELFPEATQVVERPAEPTPPEPAVAATAPGAAAPPGAAPIGARSPYQVRFSSVEQFDAVYQRDLSQGGLFVATRDPAPIGATVEIDLYLPAPLLGTVRLRARVVHRIEPQTAEGLGGPNLLAGMGVEILDPRGTLGALDPFLKGYPRKTDSPG
ncbi:MAG TPA: PilZ domain-containing protein [Thermoanaerobaculia bacterium]|nr:PilZ domain-containing protein [Thermoanaerobaculia bacterium]